MKIFSCFDFPVFTSVPRSHAQKRAVFPIAFFVLKSRFYYPLLLLLEVCFLQKREGKKGEQKQGEKEEEEDNVLVFLMAEKRRGRLEEDK